MSEEKPDTVEGEIQVESLPWTDQDRVAAEKAVERLRGFFHKKKIKQECPICGSSDWAVLEFANVEPGIPFFKLSNIFEMNSPRIAVYILSCNNCGFIRSHARNLVDEGE